MSTPTTFRIVAPDFIAGGTYDASIDILRVNDAAPVIHYMIEWSRFKVKSYCQSKGWSYEEGL